MAEKLFKTNISLKAYNTFGINAIANKFAIAKSISSLKLLIENLGNEETSELIFLGGGSNVLFIEEVVKRPIIKLDLKGITVDKEDDDHVWIKAMAGESWHDLVMYCVDYNYGGIENMSLIPGSVGAAPMQNIGAYGVEIKAVFESLEALNLSTKNVEEFDINACQFDYRYSAFKGPLKNQYCICSVTLKLSKSPIVNTTYGAIQDTLAEWNIDQPTIKDVSNAVIKIRQSKLPDPNKIGNAGSFFKNPIIEKSHLQLATYKDAFMNAPSYKVDDNSVKIPAGWLIEQCGWKGKIMGNVGSHKNQALVIVNYGGATGQEIWVHAQNVQQSVFEKYGIELEAEVNRV